MGVCALVCSLITRCLKLIIQPDTHSFAPHISSGKVLVVSVPVNNLYYTLCIPNRSFLCFDIPSRSLVTIVENGVCGDDRINLFKSFQSGKDPRYSLSVITLPRIIYCKSEKREDLQINIVKKRK